ncbi:transketolase family protein [Jatrophihabitans sp.]|uniref:transketolase family protein n=1 Tax=Jatrophihabitans sp. TaxID=1932789 RepID=UPI002C0146F4|nr:transketolase C-terminal domain-containing protein [Jatrophihabitans sp.]
MTTVLTASSREAYRDTLLAAMPLDDRLVCLDSDTGLFLGKDFGTAADRYLNLGIAEQNLLGAAAGLARCGRIPFVNTMATFASTRALETVKIDLSYAHLPVRIAATHSGLSAGNLGPTHHSLEDLAIMRLLPGMTVLVPADAAATVALFEQCRDLPGPVYLRLDRVPTPTLPVDLPPIQIGRAQPLRQGSDLLLVCCGPYPVQLAVQAAELLAARGIEAAVLNMHTVKPLDEQALAGSEAPVVTIEEHWRTGGLGSAVAEALAETGRRVLRVGVPDRFVSMAGDQRFLLERSGITAESIEHAALRALGR